MIPKKLQTYLNKTAVAAEAVVHRTVYTAYDLAQTTGIKLEQIAKTILVKVEPPYGEKKDKHIIAVLPASHQLDLKKLQGILKAKKLSIADERVMSKLFKIKAGAITPFSARHSSTPVFIDKTLLKAKKIMARSGSFTDSLFLKPKDFIKVSGGSLASFAKKVIGKK
ncbi:hypothetical protein A3I40_02970 [Candidatus Uhrbacteria bacterium RIFCSPLOWO2_02_FULL_48_12]|uniref:YbaK/aminoacyl-tRNA synthetase-associated domain-containing protein n=1 Tax=Candidatus Uhrbacteria bacterium RIFCSPLOWO2_02_FULL_48_12 TaxID=1802407 RepID=A0A1F7V9M2_9BACT|nr:MAG: hypothetical protein A3I40_02970 [Candidatus Uhrbacteria bacterium RIFCSPLOWO2_02_FULL_48_12]